LALLRQVESRSGERVSAAGERFLEPASMLALHKLFEVRDGSAVSVERLRDPPGRIGLEHREAAAAGQAVDQRGDEHGLAGARQAGDAEPYRRMEEAVAVVQKRPRRPARFLDNVRKTGGHAGVEGSMSEGRWWAITGKVAIGRPKSSVRDRLATGFYGYRLVTGSTKMPRLWSTRSAFAR